MHLRLLIVINDYDDEYATKWVQAGHRGWRHTLYFSIIIWSYITFSDYKFCIVNKTKLSMTVYKLRHYLASNETRSKQSRQTCFKRSFAIRLEWKSTELHQESQFPVKPSMLGTLYPCTVYRTTTHLLQTYVWSVNGRPDKAESLNLC